MDCLRTLVGLSDQDCNCYDTDKPVDWNTASSGLFITDELPLNFIGSAADCEQGGVWDILEKARERAIKDVLRDYAANLYMYHSQTFSPYPVSDTTNEKRIGAYKNNGSFAFSSLADVAGIYFVPRKIKGGRAVLRGFDLKLDNLTAEKIDIFIADNYRGTIQTLTVTYTSTGDFVYIPFDNPIVLEFDNVDQDLKYFIGYSIVSGARYANNEITDGCCGRTGPTYNPFLSYFEHNRQIYGFEAASNSIADLDTPLTSNNYARGMRLDMSLTCDVFAWLCALSSDPTDITQNGANGEGIRFGMMLADLIRAAAIQHAGRRILQSQNINRITMLSAESVNDIMMHQAEIYQSGIKYMARETPHWANDCLECLNDKTISKNAILR